MAEAQSLPELVPLRYIRQPGSRLLRGEPETSPALVEHLAHYWVGPAAGRQYPTASRRRDLHRVLPLGPQEWLKQEFVDRLHEAPLGQGPC